MAHRLARRVTRSGNVAAPPGVRGQSTYERVATPPSRALRCALRALCAEHGAQRTVHSAQRTRHSAQRTGLGPHMLLTGQLSRAHSAQGGVGTLHSDSHHGGRLGRRGLCCAGPATGVVFSEPPQTLLKS